MSALDSISEAIAKAKAKANANAIGITKAIRTMQANGSRAEGRDLVAVITSRKNVP